MTPISFFDMFNRGFNILFMGDVGSGNSLLSLPLGTVTAVSARFREYIVNNNARAIAT